MLPARELDDAIRPLRRAEYEKLVDDGCFVGEPLELLWGSLVRMSPQKSPHAAAIQYLNKLLVLAVAPANQAEVRIQSPFAATDDSEPEPDVAVVPPGSYRDHHPSKALLIIEVAESSVTTDRAKAAIYAAAGVPEYWIVNLPARVVEVHRQPEGGRYASVVTQSSETQLAAEALPEAPLQLRDLFGPDEE
jgi:Uma2 family endonuclease